MNRECVIYEKNRTYGNRLMSAVSKRAAMRFKVQMFTDREQLESYIKSNEPDVLLTVEESYYGDIRKLYSGRIIVLMDEHIDSSGIEELYGQDVVGVYRYQNSDMLYKEIIKEGQLVRKKEQAFVNTIAVYSPVYAEPKSAFILSLCKALGEKYNVLYMNFEEFSALDDILPDMEKGNLSDALYYYRQGKRTAVEKIKEIIGTTAGFDYIAPVKCAEDIGGTEADEMLDFIDCIGRELAYDVIVLDISEAVRDKWKILENVSCFYMPVKDDYVSARKIAQFETYYGGTGREEILDNAVKLRLPEGEGSIRPDFWDRLQAGGMYRYVKKLAEQWEASVGGNK